MKVPLNWLSDFIDLPTRDPEVLDEILGSLGHEVEGWETLRPTFEGVVVGKVEEVGAHPNADKVRFCRVNDGTSTLDVVCGAWNFEAGAVIAYATVGARLGTDDAEPFEISAREIRGVMSNGMICSARELGLGDDHEGILVLDELGLAGDADVGRDFSELLPFDDVVLDVSITPNRPDCMSIHGVARELAAYWQIPITLPDVDVAPEGPPTDARVEILDPEANPRFTGMEVDGVAMGPAPLWMQFRLLSVGQRPISNVVDVSNYVMLEMGHPIHTYDQDTISDGRLAIRRAEDGERLTTLDGVERTLVAGDILVTDPSGPIGLAGVMGGSTTEVSETTTRVLVEAAHWDPPSIMRTSHRLGLRSEASARFERGVDPNLSHLATQRTARLIVETAGGVVRPGLIDEYPTHIDPWTVDITARDVSRLLGPEPTLEDSDGLLRRLGFEVAGTPDGLRVTVPTHRPDVTRPADLVEEIARLHGYENFPDHVRRGENGALTPAQAKERSVRRILVGAGLAEAQTLSFVGQADLDLLRLPDGDARRIGIRVINPLREEEGTMRTTILPGLLKAVAYNTARGTSDVALFEVGRVFIPAADSTDIRIPHQPVKVACAAVGMFGADGLDIHGRPTDVHTVTGILEMLTAALGRTMTLSAAELPALHPGRAAEVSIDGKPCGIVGELHPAVARDFGLEGRVAVAEIDLEPLIADQPDWSFDDVSAYPPARFDLAFVVDASTPAAAVLEAARAADVGGVLESVDMFDEFTGGSLGDDQKSIAVRLVLRAFDRTLTDEEVGPLRTVIIESVVAATGAALRGG